MKDFWIVALMLFSMFFGAGNFIYPPVVGASISEFLPSTLAFTLSAVALPVLGVAAIAKSGDMHSLASRVNPVFSLVFSICIYMCIGPLFAIPRASNMPLQLVSDDYGLSTQVIYSAVYYLLNFYLCLNPSKLIDTLGKFITPMLLLVLVVLISGVLTVDSQQNLETGSMSPGQAFVEGYSTMDALAALVFGTSVLHALRSRGVAAKNLAKSCILAGLVAGVILAAVYVGLSFCGWSFSAHTGANGAVLLGALAESIFGSAGRWVLAVACFLACFSTTLGLIGSGAEHFEKWGGYKLWVGIYCLAGFAMSNLGLSFIIDTSIKVLVLLYPLAILLILSVFLPRSDWALRAAIAVALAYAGASAGLLTQAASDIVGGLPGHKEGLGWIAPCAIAWVISFALHRVLKAK